MVTSVSIVIVFHFPSQFSSGAYRMRNDFGMQFWTIEENIRLSVTWPHLCQIYFNFDIIEIANLCKKLLLKRMMTSLIRLNLAVLNPSVKFKVYFGPKRSMVLHKNYELFLLMLISFL